MLPLTVRRIVGCVMLLVPAPWLRCKTSDKPCEDTVCIQTCKPAVPSEAICPVCKQDPKAIELLFGSGLFSFQTRLTVVRHARHIVCIRTKCQAARDAIL